MNPNWKYHQRNDKLWEYLRTFSPDKKWKPLNRKIVTGSVDGKTGATYLNFEKVNKTEFMRPISIDDFMRENEITDETIGYSEI